MLSLKKKDLPPIVVSVFLSQKEADRVTNLAFKTELARIEFEPGEE